MSEVTAVVKIIYGDLLFLVNFSMDYIGLLITSRLIGRRPHLVRLLCASVLGGIYGVCSLFMVQSIYIYSIGLAVCLVMCAVAFKGGLKKILSDTLIYICISALLGGLMTALFTLVGGSFAESASNPGTSLFSIAAASVFMIASLFSKLLNRRSRAKTKELTIINEGKCVHINAALDSGNFLRDMSGRGAVVVKLDKIKSILPMSVINAALSGDVSHLTALPPRLYARVSLLFAETPIGQKMLIGYRPDRVLCDGEELDCIIALDTSGCDFGECDAIISDRLS